jgi:pimeloyl-ACP methyl ester carboxylesterase
VTKDCIQLFGDGPLDVVLTPGFISHIEYAWEEPLLTRFLRQLSSFTRVIAFDKRGMGLSDRDPDGLLSSVDGEQYVRVVLRPGNSAARFGCQPAIGGGVLSRTVANVDSIGLVLLRWIQCSAGES